MNDTTSLIAITILLLLILIGYFLVKRLGKPKQPEVAKREDLPESVEIIQPPELAESSAPPPSTNKGSRGGGDTVGLPKAPGALENSTPVPKTRGVTKGSDVSNKSGNNKKSETSEPPKDNTTIKVFYGTDRKRTGKTEWSKFYGGERNNQAPDGPMEYGICKVSIPPNHKVGNIEAPKWWKLEFRPNVKKHVVLQAITPRPKEDFFQQLKETISASSQKQTFVFVHGYNVNFDSAAKRTAQIAFDLAFDGAPIMYTWPSKGNVKSYTVDESNIQWTQPHLQQFLLDISESSGATTIHLIAHSMGNRALTRAFADLVENNETQSQKIKKIILTAPDIDADVFKDNIAPAMLKSQAHITLYASSNDRALKASRKIHGHARAGDSGEKLVVLPGIDTIDATAANTGFLGHSYFAESVDIISDILQLLRDGKRADKREGLLPKSNDFGDYWEVLDKDA